MAKKGKGLLALIAGVAAGAAAVFLSEEKNRVKTVKAVKKAKSSAQKAVKSAQQKAATKTKKTAPKKKIAKK